MTQTKDMTVQQGLNELKLYDSKITKAISDIDVFHPVDKSNKLKINNQRGTLEDAVSKSKAGLQKVMDLISYRDNLKQAIVLSNANTLVEIAGSSYTVAEAIEKKTSIAYKLQLVQKLKQGLLRSSTYVSEFNSNLDTTTQSNIRALTSNEGNKDNLSTLITELEKLNEAKKLSVHEFPVNNKETNIDLIDRLDNENTEFLSEVDYKLTESNVITHITVTV